MQRFPVVAVLVFLAALLSTGLVSKGASSYPQKQAAQKLDGKDVFLKYSCNNCHAVSTAGITGKNSGMGAPDLVDVTVRHEKPWIRRFIRQNDVHVPCPKVDKSKDGKKHPAKFTGTQEEEDSLIEWLDKQRSKK